MHPLRIPGADKSPEINYFRAFHRHSKEDIFIWGGDFNTGLAHFTFIMKTDVDPRKYNIATCDSEEHEKGIASAERPVMRVALSQLVPRHNGDLAVTYGLRTLQISSRVGRSHGGS